MKSVILAAGIGKRFKSQIPKPLHTILGISMFGWVLKEALEVTDEAIVVINPDFKVEFENSLDRIKEVFKIEKEVHFAFQNEPTGTLTALVSAAPLLTGNDTVLVLCADTPLVTSELLAEFLKQSEDSPNAILAVRTENPTGYGRIIHNDNILLKIVEEADLTEEARSIKLVNSGIYKLNWKDVIENYADVRPANKQNEYYLTDLASLLKCHVVETDNEDCLIGVNNRYQLSLVEENLIDRIIQNLAMEGVRFVKPSTIYIEPLVNIEKDCTIGPNVILKGNTTISTGTVISNSEVENSTIGKSCTLTFSVVKNSTIASNTTVGPFAHIRDGAQIGNECRIGNFVEVKNSKLEDKVKAAHLSYLGDAEVGEDANIGAGTITCNFDGKQKHKTVIEKKAFIGSNSSLVAPVKIGANSMVAAGSVITKNVPRDSLAIARARQENKEDWVRRYKRRQKDEPK